MFSWKCLTDRIPLSSLGKRPLILDNPFSFVVLVVDFVEHSCQAKLLRGYLKSSSVLFNWENIIHTVKFRWYLNPIFVFYICLYIRVNENSWKLLKNTKLLWYIIAICMWRMKLIIINSVRLRILFIENIQRYCPWNSKTQWRTVRSS